MSLISNSEERVSSYKKLLEMVGRDRVNFSPTNEFVIWYRNLLRENKNSEEAWLKKLRLEKTYENQGLNPPYFYKY